MKKYLIILAFLIAVWFVYSRFIAPKLGGTLAAAA